MGEKPATRIAMWSGPRNLSTALMRSWGNRPDTQVVDEPFYAWYLTRETIDHPGVDEVVAHHETDRRKVAAALTGALPAGKTVLYQKHMTHHLLPELDRGWMAGMVHCFLIRDPAEVIQSLIQQMPAPTLRDTGFAQQSEIFDYVRRRTGSVPPVIDARDVLQDPERILRLLCERVGLPFTERMLSWPAGARPTDGVWGRHWYATVNKSTGFQPYARRDVKLGAAHAALHRACEEHYRALYPHRLGATAAG